MINSRAHRPPAYREFSTVLDPSIYEPLPDDWIIGITDVVDSTLAISAGRYKDVNYAGASIIAALGNAWGAFDFPFVFRGDGAAFALPPQGFMVANSVMRQVAGLAATRLGLILRVGLLSVSEIRSHGHDVRIARYAASDDATYAMFSGGGLRWAERQIKNGRYLVKPRRYTVQLDLTGLTCEWTPLRSQHGEILSLLVEPHDHTNPKVFSALARQVLAVLDAAPRQSHPVPVEMAFQKGKEMNLGSGNWSSVIANSDYRKYDDGLRLTLDCTREQIDAAEAILIAAKARGEINFGLHRQSHALMTCLVPSGRPESHLHFLDGMGGGYAKAAEMMEAGEILMVAGAGEKTAMSA
ncbi:DUF3095 family protein [Microvirga sp. VF16]|uniref:DUF3095 family protein n=1 Tax=Microvirga sp. VF16 TaxID=2807101 RepID=UPI00193E314F|nr:DUF3095 family protein [Microvirga sp. VF16]QRM33582.1 DUF3095 domain-containing protein [Microvirga sp. VF16]